jgi:predicted ATPase
MIEHLRIQNFKSWRDTKDIRLAPITAFFGSNSSGKTSLLQSILALKQTAASFGRGAFDFGDERREQDLVVLGSFQDVVHRHEPERSVSIELNWQIPGAARLSPSLNVDAMTYQVEWRIVQGEVVVNDLQYRAAGVQFDLGRAELNFPLYKWSLKRPGHDIPEQSASSSPPDSCYGIPREFAHTAIDIDLLKFNLHFERLMERIAYLGPLREYPHRQYTWTGAAPKNIDPRGRGAIETLLAAQRQRTNGKAQSNAPSLIERVAYWLRRFELADQFQLTPIDTEQRNYEARLQAHGSEANLSDVGFGVSQVLPIIVLLHFVPEDSIVLLEQPEIHLHPRVQMDLADLFIEVAQTRHVQIIFESHSEHLLRRLQRRIAEESVTPDQAALYFCALERGESHLSNLKLDEFGNITNWPHDFFGDDFGEIAAMSEAGLARRAKQG